MNYDNITFKMLKYFVTLAEELHFGHAAQKLYISQPPLSMQIKALEESLGFPLFERNKRAVKLTKAGHIAYEESKKILAQMALSLDVMVKKGRAENHQLLIGVISSILQDDFFAILTQIEQHNPKLSWILKEKSPHEQMLDLAQGKIDIGFVCGRPKEADDNVILEKIQEDEVVAACAKDSGFCNKTSISLKELKGKKVVILEKKDCPYLAELYQKCMEAGLRPADIIEVNEPFSELAYMRSNYAIGLVPYNLVKNETAKIHNIPLKEKIACNLYITYGRSAQIPPHIKAFIDLFHRYQNT